MGVLLAVLGGQFMVGLSQGTSARSAVSVGLGETGGDRPADDRWGPLT
ncbi:hypothetical protein [Streptomyces sp. NPDC019224]